MLVSALDKAASEVHQTRIRIRAPKLYITPYGGRIVWTLPGKTKMIAHLKDKTKIRAKKDGRKLCTCITYLVTGNYHS